MTTVKYTAIFDTLPNKLPANLTVGTNYSFSLNTAGAATFINGKVSRGFYFRGTNGYVSPPDNAFQIASGAQTFEA